MKIEVTKMTNAEWSQTSALFSDASIFQSWAYGTVRWGEKNVEHALVHDNGDLTACAQVRVVRLPLLDKGLAYVSWGPLWQKAIGYQDPRAFACALRALRQEYCQMRGLSLRVVPRVEDSPRFRGILEAAGFRPVGHVRPYHSVEMDLTVSEEVIFENLHGKWRNSLRRVIKDDIEIVSGVHLDLFDEFQPLFNEMRERKGFEDLMDVASMRRVQELLLPPHKATTMVARWQGMAIAAVICGIHGQTALYFLGASNLKGRELNASYLLQWQMIRHLRSIGMKSYDLGGLDEAENPGSYRFKIRLAGKGGRLISQVGAWQAGGAWSSTLMTRVGEAWHRIRKS